MNEAPVARPVMTGNETFDAKRSRLLGHGPGFWVVAFAFLIAMSFSSVPTPLYVIYRQADGFSTFMLTVAFTVYALGVVISLFFAGHVSDWLGRRRILVSALLIDVISAVVFLSSTSLEALILARAISGLAVGMITATATAHIAELHAAARPASSPDRGGLVATAANLGGFAFGTLASGLLAEYVSSPLRTPYVVFLVLLVLGTVGVMLVPETVNVDADRPRYRPQRVSAAPEARPAFFAALCAAMAAFAVLGLFGSLAPGFLAGTLHHPSHALAGVVSALVFGASGTTQILLRRARARLQLVLGLSLMSVGLIGLTLGVWTSDFASFLIGGIVAGGGAGVLFKGTIATVVRLTAPDRRGEALAGLFLAAYVGMTVPVVGIGVATRYIAIENALVGFSAVILVGCAATSRNLLRQHA